LSIYFAAQTTKAQLLSAFNKEFDELERALATKRSVLLDQLEADPRWTKESSMVDSTQSRISAISAVQDSHPFVMTNSGADLNTVCIVLDMVTIIPDIDSKTYG